MTLVITVVNTFGVWQSSDHRLIDLYSGRPFDEPSIKHVTLRCCDGAAHIAYTGAGRVGNVQISDWIRETLRGENRTVDQSLILLRENATRDLGPLLLANKIAHAFSIGVFLSGNPWLVEIRNGRIDKEAHPRRRLIIGDRFETGGKRIANVGIAAAYGAAEAILQQDWDKLHIAAGRKPRDPKDFQGLLAAINRRAACNQAGRAISPECMTSHMPPAGEPTKIVRYGSRKFAGRERGSGSMNVGQSPTLLFGVDLTDIQNAVMDALANREALSQEATKKILAESVVPKNRLRK